MATQKNEQGVDVCYQHTKQVMDEIKCTCGQWLEQRVGKFGPYFNCMKCGNISFAKGMEMKSITAAKNTVTVEKKDIVVKKEYREREEKREIFTDSNDSRFFD